MFVKSVITLKNWVREYLGEEAHPDDIEKVFMYIRRKTDHPIYRKDWSDFLNTIDCKKILESINGAKK